MQKLSPEQFEESIEGMTHYYGDAVRKLFLGGAVLMLVTLPFFWNLISVPITASITIILLIGVAAGLMNPKILWVAILNTVIAAGAFVAFEYYAVDTYIKYSSTHWLFWIDQLLALDFLVAVYFGVKTVRGWMLEK